MTDLRCEVCGTTDDLRRAALMRPASPPVICSACFTTWYEYGVVTREEILIKRGLAEDLSWTRLVDGCPAREDRY